MRGVAALLLATIICSACGPPDLFRRYEYEEDVYLSLDGTATVYVNSSVAALVALHGAPFDASSSKPPDRARVRDLFSAPFIHDIRVTTSRRSGRRFVHVRFDVDDIRSMHRAAPFAWSTYRFDRNGNLFVFQQTVGPSAARDVGDVGWTGKEVVAFRLHLPSKIEYHNAGPSNPRRGNILAWEQPLTDRMRGVPLALDARMQTQSILYRTLLLFGATGVVVAAVFGLLIWWIRRSGARTAADAAEDDGLGASAEEVGRRAAAR